jgi:DNA-binding response OmpR family regulator
MKILLVEDDALTSAALAQMLACHDYETDIASNGQIGLDLAMEIDYDLILLDLLIPKLDGISLCRQLRAQGYRKSILLLTAKDTKADIIAGLDAGADDYVIKPYDPEALLARIRALLRRNGIVNSCILSWGALCVDPLARKVTCHEQVIALTSTEYNLLELFLQNPERIFSRSVILDRLWGFDDAPTDNAVTTHIKDLRKKLKAGGLSEDLLETVYGMGYRLKPAPNHSASGLAPHPQPAQHILPKKLSAIHQVLEKFRHSFVEQIAVLAAANTALSAGNFTPELHQSARQEAHKLAGSMGSFGYPEGSRLARSLEHLLIEDRVLSSDEISQFSQQVSALQQTLNQPPLPVFTAAVNTLKSPDVLVIDDDALLTQQLQAEAQSWGWRIKIAGNLAQARSHLAAFIPDAIVLDLSFAGTEEDGLTLLRELADHSPEIPIIVFTDQDTLAHRLTVCRLGARQFLHKPATPQQILQALSRVLPQPASSDAKVFVVDDDPLMLAKLSALLTPWGLEVVTLNEPQRFWEVLTAITPDIVVLDLEMPEVSGIELCQVVRQDVQWGDLPILVVTAHTDATSVSQAFSAGADDFISKPVLGPELITRVLSRIQRANCRQKANST